MLRLRAGAGPKHRDRSPVQPRRRR